MDHKSVVTDVFHKCDADGSKQLDWGELPVFLHNFAEIMQAPKPDNE